MRSPRRARLGRACGLLVALVVAGGSLFAWPAQAQAQTATLEVRIILGKNDGSGVDRSLSGIAGQLRSRFGSYDSFQQLGRQNVTLTQGASRRVSLPNGQSMTISFQGMSGSSYRLSVSLPGGGGTVTAAPGGMFFVAGPPHNGGTIIVSITP